MNEVDLNFLKKHYFFLSIEHFRIQEMHFDYSLDVYLQHTLNTVAEPSGTKTDSRNCVKL